MKSAIEVVSPRVLVVDDEPHQCEMLSLVLGLRGASVKTETSARSAIERANHEEFDVVLADVNMGEMSGLDMSERILEKRPHLPIVLVTGSGTLDTAVDAMRRGIFDFLVKPVDTQMLFAAVNRAARHRALSAELRRLPADTTPSPPSPTDPLAGQSGAMRRVYEIIERLRGSDPSVVVYGESGTGKERIAKALHASSSRADGPLVAVNCAAIPPALLESELFGHARGAFTDAKTPREGLFARANGGTLVLDEISEMPLEMQSKLLRALQERTVRPVGSNDEIPFDARLISVTNRDLETEVEEGRFREDLYYRINVVAVHLPPLRERGNDILQLANQFLLRFAERAGKRKLRLSTQVAERLLQYDWPGNVRELENCIERAVAMARFDQITVDDLHERVRAYRADQMVLQTNHPDEIVTLAELERRYIQRVLKLVNGNKSRAAQLLGLDRRTLYRKLDRRED